MIRSPKHIRAASKITAKQEKKDNIIFDEFIDCLSFITRSKKVEQDLVKAINYGEKEKVAAFAIRLLAKLSPCTHGEVKVRVKRLRKSRGQAYKNSFRIYATDRIWELVEVKAIRYFSSPNDLVKQDSLYDMITYCGLIEVIDKSVVAE